ncbi:uncharacterized protein [Diadema antillarum]|uniref:uncharacterized protein n=1 Tax=Diadema antillarum TaxID=105358 RepID=UPI003A8A390F
MPTDDRVSVYVGFIRPLLEYACPVWHSGLTAAQAGLLERVQKRALRTILPHCNYEVALETAQISSPEVWIFGGDRQHMRQHMMDESQVSLRTSMFRTSTIGWVVLANLATLVSFAYCDSTSSASLNAYHPLEYINPVEGHEFIQFTKDPKTENFYIGANRALLQLSTDLNRQRIVSTAPDPETCEIPCNNQNRILIVAPDPIDRLITCEDYSKTCQLRNLANISSAERYPNVVINSGSSAVGVLTSGGSSCLYVGVGPNFLINQVEKIPYVTRWEMQPPFSSSSMTTQQSPEAAQLKFQVHFLDGFSYEGFTYFVTTQMQLQEGSYPDDAPYVSMLSRVCQSPTASLDSFTELPITCSSGEGRISYNLIQAVEVSVPGMLLAESFASSGGALLYAVFTAEEVPDGVDEPQSALCIYRMSDIQEKFLDAVFECLTEQTPPISHLPGSCFIFQFTREQARDFQCEDDPFYNYAAAQEPLPAEAALELNGVHATSISIATEEMETVAFIGTETGDLLKAHLNSSSYARKYEVVTVGSTPIKQITLFNSSDDQLYVLTEQKLVRLSTVNCCQYKTCNECIGESGADDGDPYCGWCTLLARCTRYRDCMHVEKLSRWLPFSSEECVGIEDTSVGLSLPVSSPSQTVIMATRCQTSELPLSLVVEAGTSTHLRCTVTGGTASNFTWIDASVSPPIIMFSGGNKETANAKYVHFTVSDNTTSSTLIITATQIAEEGIYFCQASEVADPAPAVQVIVEVRPTLTLMLNSTLIAGETYEAVCRAEGSRAAVDIEWYLNNVQQTVDPPTSVPSCNSDLTDTTSTFTFTAARQNDGQSLRCETTGYQVASLNQRQSVFLNLHSDTGVRPTTSGETSVQMSESPPDACACDCPSSGMIAAVSIMGVLLAVSITVNVLQFYKQSKASSQVLSTSETRARTGISGDNENSTYEMIESGTKGRAVYQQLTPSTAAVESENLTFFSGLGCIGTGKFGDVWKGELRSKEGVTSVALRQITENIQDLMQVVKYLQELPHNLYIVRCLGYCNEYRTIIYEFVSGGTLLTFLQFNLQSSKSPYGNIKRPRPRFDESQLLKYAWQVAKGMEFLASNKIVHGNLCAHTILMTEDRVCKISDYGMTSCILPAGNEINRWTSPEGMQNNILSLQGDVWSYGILLWEIVTLGARPYPKMTMDMVKQLVINGYKMPRPSHCTEELYSLMTSCWEMDPEERCAYHVILQKLEPTMGVYHEYLSFRDLDEELYDDVADITV